MQDVRTYILYSITMILKQTKRITGSSISERNNETNGRKQKRDLSTEEEYFETINDVLSAVSAKKKPSH